MAGNFVDIHGKRVEIIRPDEEKFVKKLIYFKRFEHSPVWHFALPETAQIGGLLAFCGLICWPKVQTSNQKLFHNSKDKNRNLVCDACAGEMQIARDELIAQGYI